MSITHKSMAKNAQMSPSQRAAVDAARYKARTDKASKAPGPGAYESPCGLGSIAKDEPTAAFKSQTLRSHACTLLHGSDLAASSLSTHMDAANGSPGPGKYIIQSTDLSDSRPSSAFSSGSARCIVTPTTFPGVGTYSPERSLSKNCPCGHAPQAAFSSSSPRFKPRAVDETAANLGPGSYSPKNSMGSNAGASGAQSSRSRPCSAPFGSSSSRGLANSAACNRSAQPALSSASPLSASTCSGRARTTREAASCSTASAAQSTGAGSSPLTSSASFSRCAQAGACAFGATAPRGGTTGGSNYPGPGQYSSPPPASALRQSSAFASNSSRCAPTADLSPGVGAYSPRQSTLASKSAAATAFRSTEVRFKELAERTGRLGPGSYGQVHATMEEDLNSRAGQMSAAFASTTLRD